MTPCSARPDPGLNSGTGTGTGPDAGRDPGPAPAGRHRSGRVLALLALAGFITSLDYNIVYVALPRISGLGFSPQSLQWVVSAYAVAFGAVLLFGGRASDLLGRRRMFVVGLALYAVSSLAGGLATEPGLLVAGRVVQGVGGAILFPATLALLTTTFAEGAARNRALSLWAATGSCGLVLGSLLGGVLTQAFGWRAVFFVNVPLAALGILLTPALLPADPARARSRVFDLPGALAAGGTATLLVYTLVQAPAAGWTSPLIVGTAAGAIVLGAAFWRFEVLSSDPLMPPRLLRNPNLRVGVAVNLVFMATFGTLLYFLTLYLQDEHGYSPVRMGTAYLVPLAGGLLGSLSGGRMVTRLGVRTTLATGLVLGAAGIALLGLAMSPTGSYPALVPGLVFSGLGQGIVYTAMFAAATTGVRAAEQGVASGIVSTAQQVGSAMGLALLVALANSRTGGVHTAEALRSATTDGLRLAVLTSAAAITATLALTLALPGRALRDFGRLPARLRRSRPGECADRNGHHGNDQSGRTVPKCGAMAPESEQPPPGDSLPTPSGTGISTTPQTKESARARYGAVFSVHEFRAIFAAHVLSTLGSVFAEVSLAVLVFRQTRSALLTALVFALGFLPYALSGVLLSGIADRQPPRRVLVICDLLSAAGVTLMAIPATPLAVLFVLRFALSMISPLFTGTRAASLAEIMQGDHYVLGRSLVRIVSQTSQIIGYGLGGLALIWLSPRTALCMTICTFLSSALLLRLGTHHRPARISGGGAMMRDSITSARQLLGNPRIRALLLMWWTPPMFFVVAEGVAAPFAGAAGAGSAGFGLFLAAMPAGTVVSEALAGTLLGPAARDRIALPLAAMSLLPMAAFAAHPPLPAAAALMLLTGLCAAYTLGMDKWFVEAVPEEMRGRAMSLLGAGIMTLQGLGMAIGGAVATSVPPYAVICGAGTLGTISVLAVLRSVRQTT